MKIDEFGKDLLETVLAETEAQPEGEYYENVFTRNAIEWLVDVGEVVDPELCYFKGRGLKVNAWDLHDDNDSLDLFVSIFEGTQPSRKVPRGEVQDAIDRCTKFLERAMSGLWKEVEESGTAFDAAKAIAMSSGRLKRSRVYLLTNGVAPAETVPDSKVGQIIITHHIWDLERFYQVFGGATGRELIDIDQESLGGGIRCVQMPGLTDGYTAYVGIIPGAVLANLYEKWGQRLLERNVRSYLQARGNVNKAIQKTLVESPEMFLAYNNGISTTADTAEIAKGTDGQLFIRRLHNLQIVNGAQTTASIYEAARHQGADLSKVNVQIKLTVLTDPKTVDLHVPLISRYANSQTKVNVSDFSANHPYHVELEKLSRATWVPNPEGKGKSTTKWYYERARGSYLSDLHAAGTPAKRTQFKLQYPVGQKLTKPLVAKFEMAWNQLPNVVSLGAEKNFSRFMDLLSEKGTFAPDERYFKHLVAKAILFKRCDQIVRDLEFGGYKANVVAYAIAYLSNRSGQLLNLDAIWDRQDLSPTTEHALRSIAAGVWEHITHPPREGMNIGEWCKKEQCWTNLREQEIAFPPLDGDLVEVGQRPVAAFANKKVPKTPTPEEETSIARVAATPPEVWFGLSAWAKQTENLDGWERSLAYDLGRLVARKRPVSPKQAFHGLRILGLAVEKGFNPQSQKPRVSG